MSPALTPVHSSRTKICYFVSGAYDSLRPVFVFPRDTAWSMTARQIRRAAERKARKEERKQERKYEALVSKPPQDAKIIANRTNAQRSTGPRTEAGKAISSQNALKTALTGRTVLLPTDDRARYEQHLTHYFALWNPIGEHECTVVQLLADTWWRLLRIPYLEAAIYAKGRMELTDVEPDLLESEVYLKYEKQLRNLFLQERRLSNYADRLKAELQELQSQRQAVLGDLVQAKAFREPVADELGFEFSPTDSSFAHPLSPIETTAEFAKTADAASQNSSITL